tara:strand:+ start:17489 stop:18619 length:1131 start_codon:yes stop_codon:yes gene_type:complete
MKIEKKSEYPYFWNNGEKKPIQQLSDLREKWKKEGKNVVTTNGCFDLIHPGHTQFLSSARNQGDILIVGINSDPSVHALKGPGKPILKEEERAEMLSALKSVDAVLVFDDLLPNGFLEAVKPDIHCKAADYSESSLPEADIVKKMGGKISILPLVDGFSSTNVVERILSVQKDPTSGMDTGNRKSDVEEQILTYLLSSSNIFRQTAYTLKEPISKASEIVIKTLKSRNKILLCGNGGSAADSQHIAAELVGRFKRERTALPAIALTTDSSILTAIANDYGFEEIFSRQITALGRKNDLLIAISTSGSSKNVVRAIEEAHHKGMVVIGLTGELDSPVSEQADLTLKIPTQDTALIQQVHIGIMHLICDLAEIMVFES